MATFVTFHAHPDDEAIGTGGVMAKAAAEGHRVVLVVATRGELGEVPKNVAGIGAPLAEWRTQETHDAADILGVSRVEFLGYTDSGMAGESTNDDPRCFWQARIDQAAQKLANILEEERPEVFTYYDENGIYGHPDHLQAHRVGARAAELVYVPNVFMNTVDRVHSRAVFDEIRSFDLAFPAGGPDMEMGVMPDRITTIVDVEPFLDKKRAAMAAHASQVSEGSIFLGLPDEYLRKLWGTERFIKVGAPAGYQSNDLFVS